MLLLLLISGALGPHRCAHCLQYSLRLKHSLQYPCAVSLDAAAADTRRVPRSRTDVKALPSCAQREREHNCRHHYLHQYSCLLMLRARERKSLQPERHRSLRAVGQSAQHHLSSAPAHELLLILSLSLCLYIHIYIYTCIYIYIVCNVCVGVCMCICACTCATDLHQPCVVSLSHRSAAIWVWVTLAVRIDELKPLCKLCLRSLIAP